MRYVFLALVVLNAVAFGYYNFLYTPDDISTSLEQTQASLANPVNATNVSSELPPMIGTKK